MTVDLPALREGQPDAVDQFYRRYARTVLGWTIRLGGPNLDAEAVAQDVFLTALKRVHLQRGERVEPWLFAVTRRVVANARRRATLRRFFSLDAAPEPVHAGPSAEDAVHQLERRRVVQGVLMSLGEREREVLVLCDMDERTAPQAAEILGISVGTVYSRLHHARKRFRDRFQKRGGVALIAPLSPRERA